jgi:hypothetical protein
MQSIRAQMIVPGMWRVVSNKPDIEFKWGSIDPLMPKIDSYRVEDGGWPTRLGVRLLRAAPKWMPDIFGLHDCKLVHYSNEYHAGVCVLTERTSLAGLLLLKYWAEKDETGTLRKLMDIYVSEEEWTRASKWAGLIEMKLLVGEFEEKEQQYEEDVRKHQIKLEENRSLLEKNYPQYYDQSALGPYYSQQAGNIYSGNL